jgi:hypothetical protein
MIPHRNQKSQVLTLSEFKNSQDCVQNLEGAGGEWGRRERMQFSLRGSGTANPVSPGTNRRRRCKMPKKQEMQ